MDEIAVREFHARPEGIGAFLEYKTINVTEDVARAM
jgi:hypothetical protein